MHAVVQLRGSIGVARAIEDGSVEIADPAHPHFEPAFAWLMACGAFGVMLLPDVPADVLA